MCTIIISNGWRSIDDDDEHDDYEYDEYEYDYDEYDDDEHDDDDNNNDEYKNNNDDDDEHDTSYSFGYRVCVYSTVCRAWCVFTIWVIQSMKLLTLMGVTSTDIFTSAAVILTYTRPFMIHLWWDFSLDNGNEEEKEGKRRQEDRRGYGLNKAEEEVVGFDNGLERSFDGDDGRSKNDKRVNVSILTVLFYFIMAFLATNAARSHIIDNVLILLTWRESMTGDWAHLYFAISMYTTFASTMFWVFYPRLKSIRK